jgi:hypothetical protein
MKKLSFYIALLGAFAFFAHGCSKPGNYVSINHTIGMTNTMTWSGNSWGYSYGDTLEGDHHFSWPEYFNRNIVDTSFAVQNIDGFDISIMGAVLAWRSTDSVAKTVKFDSVISGSLTASLVFYYSKDSIVFNYIRVYGKNDTDNIYYQTNYFLYTHH